MALTYTLVKAEAEAIQSVCEEVAALKYRIDQVLTHNSNQAIDWAAESTPAYITEDAAGNLQSETFTRQATANAIGSLAQIQNLLTNQAVSQGDHIGNINQLAKPLA